MGISEIITRHPDHQAATATAVLAGRRRGLPVADPDDGSPDAGDHTPTGAIRVNRGGEVIDTGAMNETHVYFRGEPAVRRTGLNRHTALRLAADYGGRPDDAAKDGPLDVAVWQAEEPGHPAWESPWGRGRPGCTRRPGATYRSAECRKLAGSWPPVST